jgi:hypothetical protein
MSYRGRRFFARPGTPISLKRGASLFLPGSISGHMHLVDIIITTPLKGYPRTIANLRKVDL